jgi:hypothetical protein
MLENFEKPAQLAPEERARLIRSRFNQAAVVCGNTSRWQPSVPIIRQRIYDHDIVRWHNREKRHVIISLDTFNMLREMHNQPKLSDNADEYLGMRTTLSMFALGLLPRDKQNFKPVRMGTKIYAIILTEQSFLNLLDKEGIRYEGQDIGFGGDGLEAIPA